LDSIFIWWPNSLFYFSLFSGLAVMDSRQQTPFLFSCFQEYTSSITG
jgi:hypothetical protein